MADELSLLWKLRADNTQAKTVMADTKTAVASLQRSFGPELAQTVSFANKAFADIGDNLTNLVGQHIPLVGNAFVNVTTHLRGFSEELRRGGPRTAELARQIDTLSKSSGKSTTEITNFLRGFVRLETQAAKNEAAFKLFGGSMDLVGNKTAKFLPELEKAGVELSAVATASTSAGASLAAMAGPAAIAVVAIAANVAIVVSLTKALFDLAKASADYQGKLFDLSQQTGVSVETLSALEVVARTTGGSIESLTQSLGIFQKNLEAASEDADSKAGKAFKKLGVDATDTEQALRQTIAALARMPEGFKQTAAAIEVFGRGGKAFLAIAKESKGDLDAVLDRLKKLGLVTTEQARQADEFNDQLTLLEIQLRGVGTEAVPVFLDALKDLSTTLEQNRDLFDLTKFGIKLLAAELVGPLRSAFGFLNLQIATSNAALKPLVDLLDRFFDRSKQLPIPGGTPTPPVQGPTKDPFTKQLEEEVAARKKLQGVLNFEFEERRRQAQSSIAEAQREFEAGNRTRKELLDATLAGVKKQTQAEIDSLKTDRKIKLEEQALAKDDAAKQAQIGNAILAIDTQIASKREELRQRELDERAKFQREEIAGELAHQERLLEQSRQLDAINIKSIEQRVALGKKVAFEGDKEIEAIELTAIDRAQALLVKRLDIAGKDLDKRKEIQDQIKALNVERTAIEQRHSEQQIQILTRESDTALQLIQLTSQSIISAARDLADQRVITEEDAARRIAKAQIDAVDAEIERAKSLGQDLRVLNAQREAQQVENERNIEAGRQRDLENEQRYAEELERIKDRVRNIERETAREVIGLMRASFASRRDIIRAQRDFELQDEEDRHRRVTSNLRTQQRNVEQEIKTLRLRLDRLKVGTTEEIEEYDRLIAKIDELKLKRLELEGQQAAEDERSRRRRQRVTEGAQIEERDVSPFGRLDLDLENLKRISSVIDDSIVPLNETLANSFFQVADAIGQTVANYVLLGETGPAVMRKILAQALASLAAEAAVQAIKELALGFATLFFNPAESAGHFTAAALWGSIGGVAAVAGRGVAGDLFKQKNAGGTGGSTSNQPGQLNPLALERNNREQTLRIVLEQHIKSNDSHIVKTVVKDFQSGGDTREAFINDGALVG